jgi:hypothetical protein
MSRGFTAAATTLRAVLRRCTARPSTAILALLALEVLQRSRFRRACTGMAASTAEEGVPPLAAEPEPAAPTGRDDAACPPDDDAEESEEEGRPAAPPTDAPLPLGDDEFPDEALALVCRFLGLRELGRLACAARRFTEPGGGGLHSLGSCPPELQRVLA